MVLFANTSIGQYVEVKLKHDIVCGTVRYKGHLNGAKGEWIGITLEYPVGQHNGCWRGRQYFKCSPNCGVFTNASKVRFRRSDRRSRDNYRKVSSHSYVDETLFNTPAASETSPCFSVSKKYVEMAKSSFQTTSDSGFFPREKRYPLSHSIGKSIPAATMLKPTYSQVSYHSQPTHYEYYDVEGFGNQSASIPHYTMPHEALKRQLKRGGWEEFGLHRPRFTTV